MSEIVLYTSSIGVETRRHTETIAFQLKALNYEFAQVDIMDNKDA